MTSTHTYSRWRPHPWHGLDAGDDAPAIVNVYIEITPFDVIKYEIDKRTGYLCVDRPQRGSSTPPALYGFVPRTYCGERVARLSGEAHDGDGDPMDVCVLSERPIDRADVIVRAKVVGGIGMVDADEADDKIVAVLHNDLTWGTAGDVGDLPRALVQRLEHYFGTYKIVPGEEPTTRIVGVYGREHALQVVRASMADYAGRFPGADEPSEPGRAGRP